VHLLARVVRKTLPQRGSRAPVAPPLSRADLVRATAERNRTNGFFLASFRRARVSGDAPSSGSRKRVREGCGGEGEAAAERRREKMRARKKKRRNGAKKKQRDQAAVDVDGAEGESSVLMLASLTD